MEFKVLGPFGVTHEGAPVALGGPKQQTVLGVLLVRADTVVSADRLIDEVWGESPPDSARRTLQSFVANLRKALNLETEILRGRPPGYLLKVDSSAVDSESFAAIVEEATALSPQDPDTASAMLHEGLAMWEGRPFDGLADNAPSLYAEMVRLEELRITAVEQRIQCDLGVGKHCELIAELEYLTAEYPLRERLWQQLMTAQYRSGRQADALRSYQKARHVLADELGIEPARELQQLEEHILLQDVQLDHQVGAEPALAALGPPQPGQVIRGYELRELVRADPTEKVFRAYQAAMGREVAFTAIEAALAREPDFIRNFDEGVRRIGRLEHPHIVPIYDFWRDPGGAFIVSRWVRGVSLRDTFNRGSWRWDAALGVIEQVGDALRSAHRKGIVPARLSSRGVVIDEEGNAHVTSFHHSFPARLADQPAGESRQAQRDDTTTLGVLLLEALTGTAIPEVELETETGREDWVSQQLTRLPDDVPATIEGLIRRTAFEVDDAFQTPDELLTAISVLRPGRVRSATRPDARIENPYKGLRAFHEADAEDFFGRDALVEQLLARLAGTTTSRFVAVVGPSGSGKSSVVRAGLIPAVRTDSIPGAASWFVATMVPGRYPFEELEAALLRIAVDPQPGLLSLLTSDPTGLHRALERVLPSRGAELLMVIDQLEELFTIAEEETRNLFIDSLANAVADPRSRLRVVVTLRADFYDRPLHHPQLGRLMRDGLTTVIPLTPSELQQAISGPAERAGVEVEPDLAGRMIADVADRPGALPLLQYVLTELFEKRDGRRMTLDSYEAIGGINGALGRRSEEVFASLTDAARRTARQLFLRLVTVEGATQETRNRVSRRSLTMLANGGAMSQAIDAFAAARLLAFDADPVSGRPTVEVAHESIFRAWPRLEEWIEASRGALHAQRRLAAAVTDWIGHDRDDDYLASGRRLGEFESVDTDGQLDLFPLEREYVTASRHRIEATHRRRSRVRRVVMATLLAAAVVAGALAIFAMAQQRSAEAEARTALARELAAASVANLDVDPELSILLALDAVTATSEDDGIVLVQAEEALHLAVQANRLIRTIPDTTTGTFSPDGATYAAGDDLGAVRLWDLSSGGVQELPEPHQGPVTALAFSAHEDRVVSSSRDGTAKVWDTQTGDVRTFEGHFGEVVDVAISTDGRLLATTSGDGTARVWDLASDSEEELLIEPNATAAVAFDATASRLAVIDPFNPEVRLVDWRTGETAATFPHHSRVIDLAFLDDGSQIATASEDGTVTLWDTRTATAVQTYGVKSLDLDFNERSHVLATAGDDGIVRVWDPAKGGEPLVLAGHRGQVTSVSFDPSGTRLASAGVDGTARIWDVTREGNREVVTLLGIANPTGVSLSGDSRYLGTAGAGDDTSGPRAVIWDAETWTVRHDVLGAFALTVSPDGSAFAAIREELAVTVRDMMNGDELFELLPEPAATAIDITTAVTFTPDGRFLISGDAIGSVQIWEAASGRLVATMPGSHVGAVEDLALDASGRFLLSVGSFTAEPALVWDVASARAVSAPAPEVGLTAAALRPDGLVVLTGGPDGVTRAWSAATGEALEAPFLQGSSTVRSISHSAGGDRIATASDDGFIRLWDATTGDLLLRWPAHDAGATDVAFSDDGRFLVSTGADGTTRVYVAQIEDLVTLAQSRVSRSLTESECRRFLHLAACPDDP